MRKFTPQSVVWVVKLRKLWGKKTTALNLHIVVCVVELTRQTPREMERFVCKEDLTDEENVALDGFDQPVAEWKRLSLVR